jgi:glutamine amidotransferase
MCIAIYLPKGTDVLDDDIKRAHWSNPDGCGMAYIDKDKGLTVHKDMKYKRFMKRFRHEQRSNPDSPFFIHLRKKTHGAVKITTCHPFVVKDDCVFMHNGTIHPEVPATTEKDVSDTMNFNENVLKLLPKGWYRSEGIKRLIEHYIGKSRIAVMNSKGDVYLFNELLAEGVAGKAHWHNNVWYSNEYYKEKPVVQVKNYGTGYNPWTGRRYSDVDDADFNYRPHGAEWCANAIWFKWDSVRRVKQGYDRLRCEWRDWDNEADTFKTFPLVVANRNFVDTDDQELYRMENCDACKKAMYWYELETYRDDDGHDHLLCDECKKAFEDVGLRMMKIDFNQKEAK